MTGAQFAQDLFIPHSEDRYSYAKLDISSTSPQPSSKARCSGNSQAVGLRWGCTLRCLLRGHRSDQSLGLCSALVLQLAASGELRSSAEPAGSLCFCGCEDNRINESLAAPLAPGGGQCEAAPLLSSDLMADPAWSRETRDLLSFLTELSCGPEGAWTGR